MNFAYRFRNLQYRFNSFWLPKYFDVEEVATLNLGAALDEFVDFGKASHGGSVLTNKADLCI